MKSRLLVFGLGNPGRKYDPTRHNAGAMALAAVAERVGIAVEKRTAEFLFGGNDRWILARSRRMMNECGPSVAAALSRFRRGPESLLVLSDDIDLPLGALRIRPGGSSGGHRGLASIIASLGTQRFARLRIGIGPVPPGTDPAEFVLSPFSAPERPPLKKVLEICGEAILAVSSDGVERAMSRYNRRTK